MVMIKSQKMEFVKKAKSSVKKYKTVGLLQLDNVPDRLIQKVRNQLKPGSEVIMARRTLMQRVLEGDENTKKLMPHLNGNVALVLTNLDPFELHKIVSANKIKLGAKPNQISPDDIFVEAGETTIPPGQAVTDLKAGGIDVQIQKGKVVIGKSKVIVKKGDKISLGVTKALKLLDVQPFSAQAAMRVIYADNLMYTAQALSVTPEVLTQQIATGFTAANAISLEIGMVTKYNIDVFIKRAYLGAMGVGLTAKVYQPGDTEKQLADAMGAALHIEAATTAVPAQPPAEGAAPAETPNNA